MTISTRHTAAHWMTALAIPTFFMPVLLLIFLGWILSVFVLKAWSDLHPDWLLWGVVYPLLALCLILWPVYIVWAVKSSHLTSYEKLRWVGMIVFTNIIGMPIFYAFMQRRYQGTDTLISPREAARIDKFCATHGLCRAHFTEQQYHILAKYIQRVHSARWAIVPVVLVSGFLLYMACWAIPQLGFMMFSDWLPIEHRVVVDETNAIQYESVPEQEVVSVFLQTVMMFGAASGVVVVMAFMFVAQSIIQIFSVKRGMFIKFLQATSSTESIPKHKGDEQQM